MLLTNLFAVYIVLLFIDSSLGLHHSGFWKNYFDEDENGRRPQHLEYIVIKPNDRSDQPENGNFKLSQRIGRRDWDEQLLKRIHDATADEQMKRQNQFEWRPLRYG